MTTTSTPKVDPTVAFTQSSFVPSSNESFEIAYDAVHAAIDKARAAHRRPVMLEVIVRVAPQ